MLHREGRWCRNWPRTRCSQEVDAWVRLVTGWTGVGQIGAEESTPDQFNLLI